MCKIRLDDSCLNHLTNIPVGFTRKSSYIHTFWEVTYQKYYVFCWQGCVRTWRNLYRYATVQNLHRLLSLLMITLCGLPIRILSAWISNYFELCLLCLSWISLCFPIHKVIRVFTWFLSTIILAVFFVRKDRFNLRPTGEFFDPKITY